MKSKGISYGLPFIWHFGMWGDLILISPLLAFIVARYWRGWSARDVLISAGVAIAATAAMGWFYTLGELPEAHMHDHRQTPAGIVHLIYMAVAITIFVLTFFYTSNLSVLFVVGISALLILHVFFGTHLALGALSYFLELPWYPNEPLRDPAAWAT